MENHTQNIELINSYLNKRLSKSEIQNFENRLKTDSNFNTLFDEHKTFLEGIKRQQLKKEIVKGKQSFVRNKWFKFLGIISSGLLVLFAVIYFNVFNSDIQYLKNKLNFETEYVQNFHVAIDSIIEIVGEKGTVIRFNPNDLETNPNKPFVGDSLEVELIELTTKQDLLLANAQTISNGKWLISGGAFKIDIKANGKSLDLKEGKTIYAQFPKNTSEDGMQIFYGKRDKEYKMNWEVSNIKLENKKYYVFSLRDSSIIDEVLAKEFGVDMFKDIFLVDTLGSLSYEKIVEKFPEIEDIKIGSDTLRIGRVPFYKYKYSQINSLINDKVGVYENEYVILSKEEAREILEKSDSIIYDIDFSKREYKIKLFSKKKFEDIINENRIILEQAKVENKLFKFTNNFYETVQLSKLGWINIDKYTRDEEVVNMKLEFNVNTSFNEIYIVDQKNNTVLNVYNHEVDLPVNRSFYIIAVGIKGKDIYGFKKSIRVNKSGGFKIEYKKITEDQIKSILTIQNSIGDDNTSSRNKDKATIIDSDTSKGFSEDKVISANNKTVSKLEETQINFQSKKTPQKLKVNTQKDTVLVLKEGTKLIIKANSFVDTKDNLINGTIDLNVTEYYKLSDMLLANLSTTSNGKQLETGGMLYVEAKKDEANLKLGENSSIEILFPTVNKKEGMQLFSGEWKNDIINWQLEKKTEEVIVDEDFEVPFAVIEEVPIYPGCENGSNVQKRRCTSAAIQEFVQRNFNTRMAQSIGLIGRQRANVIFKIDKFGNITSIRSRGTHPLIEQEANRVIASLPKMTPGKQRGRVVTVPYSLPIIFTIFEATEVNITLGEINSVPLNNQVEYDTLYTSVRGKVEQIRSVMHDKDFKVDSTYFKTWESYFKEKLIRIIGEPNNKKVILRKPLFEKENTRFKILEDDSISRGGHVIRKVWNESQIPTTSRIMRLIPKPQIIVDDKVITEEEFKKRLQNPNDNKTITTKAINNYAMSVLDLGWINLDRFIKNSNTVNYKIKVKNRNGGAKVSMVFKSLRSILPSRNIKGHFSFGRVTKKEDVTLVAIKKQKDKLYLDIIETKTQDNPSLEFNFKEVSIEKMKSELQKLDNLFN